MALPIEESSECQSITEGVSDIHRADIGSLGLDTPKTPNRQMKLIETDKKFGQQLINFKKARDIVMAVNKAPEENDIKTIQEEA